MVFFGGKGGVGKTTCAAAWAWADAHAGRRVLLVSTDPAHSLGDALDARLSSRVSRVRLGGRPLDALELDGPRAYRRWLVEHRGALGDAVAHGTWLDRGDIDALLQLSIPGIDELVALLEITRLAAADPEYDSVVIDTAPTGHTLRLLGAPATVAAVAGVLDALQAEHRLIREQLARVGRPDAADRLIALLAAQATRIASVLHHRTSVRFYWVLLPEGLSVAESRDGLRALRRLHIHVPEVIVNRILPDGPPCPVCDRRRALERRVMATLPSMLPHRSMWRAVRASVREPRGAGGLARIGKQLLSEPLVTGRPAADRRPATSSLKADGRAPLTMSLVADDAVVRPDVLPQLHRARLLMFGGKGGVGKTTAAAAMALRMARASPGRPVLLISTDPAHSLADVFGVAVGDRQRTIPGGPKNLQVRELDAVAALARRREGLDAALSEIMAALGSRETTGEGGHRLDALMDLAPPGIDELLGVLEIAEQVRANPDMLVIVDTAPTGHTLRLLETPDAARAWVQALLGILLKYRAVVRPGPLAEALVSLSKAIRALQALLHDPAMTRVIVVTRAAEVPRLETERLLSRLRRLRLAMPALVVNAMTLAAGGCGWCRAIAAAEQRALRALVRTARRRLPECAIILTPLSTPPPRGVRALAQWAATWQEHNQERKRQGRRP